MRLALLVVLALAGCGRTRAPSPESLYGEARALLRSERYAEASAKAGQALQSLGPDSALRWKLLLLKVEIQLGKREIRLAQAALEEVRLPSGPQWAEDWARYRLCQANIAYRRKDPGAAQRLDEAEASARAARAQGLLQEIELRRASLDIQDGQPDAAEARLKRVLEAVGESDPYLEMSAAGNLGYLFLQSFRYEEAIPWCQRALSSARRLDAADSAARALGNLGTCYDRLGDWDKARGYYEESQARFARTGNRYEQQIRIGSIGNLFLYRREFARAAESYKRALAVARDLGVRDQAANWLYNLAKTAVETGDWPAAEAYNNEALALWREFKDRASERYAIANAGRIAAGRKDFARSVELFRSIIPAAAEDPELLLYAHAGLARTYIAMGRDREAEAEFRATNALVERQRAELLADEAKLTYFSSRIEFYQEYVDFLMTRGQAQAALEVAESSRARDLADKLRLPQARSGRHTAAGFQRIAAAAGATLLSYWLSPRKSYLWVITPAKISWFPLPRDAEIGAWVESYDAFLQRRRDALELQPAAGRSLYETLIRPALPLLAKSGKVILVPDGPLYSLNFETLPVPGERPHYWIEDATVAITPSLGLLSPDGARRAPAGRSLLLIGNPVSPSEQYPPLAFSGQEMSSIEKSLPAFQKVVYDGPQAQPEVYARSDPGRFTLIHFVAHATANREAPLESAVILSRSGANYRLRARDVIRSRLRADLVTISACRSAGARTYAGEGLVGFAWAFLQAGARHVIAGLWEVDDQATAELMANLYAELSRSRAPADALRAAKLRLVHSTGPYRRPYYWGPFQVFTRSR